VRPGRWESPHAAPYMLLTGVSEQIKNFAVVYLVDISEVPDFNTMYELYDPCTTMFFFR
jgi:DIM1 family U5 snRNP protein